jgi:histidinol dehydrogenase
MVKRLKEVGERRHRNEGLESRLNRHPHLRARIEGLLDIIDNAGDDVEKASAAEQRVMEELRKMGNEALHCWAENQEHKKTEQLEQSDTEVNKKVKKNSTGTRASER